MLADVKPPAAGGAQMVFVDNQSDYPVIVTDVTLQKCVNMRGLCSNRKLAVRVAQHSVVDVLRLVPRDSTKAMTFEYAYVFKAEDPKSPTAIAAAKKADSVQKANTAAAKAKLEQMLKVAASRGVLSEESYDSLVAAPMKLELSVGETVDLTAAISLHVRSASGKEIPLPQAQVLLSSGADILAMDGPFVRGLKAGDALLVFSMGLSADTSATAKGTVRIPVKVVP